MEGKKEIVNLEVGVEGLDVVKLLFTSSSGQRLPPRAQKNPSLKAGDFFVIIAK